MSPTSSRTRLLNRLRPSGDGGFGLIEVMVAFGIFSLVSTATLGLVLSSLRDTGRARLETVGRNLVQAQLEQLRALPFQAPTGSTLLSDFYPNGSGTGVPLDTTGFVPAGAPRDAAAGDPPAGAFYRTVLPIVPGQTAFSLATRVQLLDATGAPTAPPAAYNPRTSTTTRMAALFVTARWSAMGAPRNYSVRTELTGSRATDQRVLLRGRMVAARVTGGLDASRKVTLEAGGVTVDGSLVQDAAAAASGSGAFAGVSDGQRVDGATGTVAAPPDSTMPDVSGAATALTYSGTDVATFGASTVKGMTAAGAYQKPRAGSSTAPVSSSLAAPAAGSTGLSLDNRLAGDAPVARLQLAAGPAVDAVGPTCSPGCPLAAGTGWAAGSDNAVTHAAESVVTATAGGIRMLRTSFAPEGLVQVALDSATLSCKVSATYGGAPSAQAGATYAGTVRYWRYDPATATGSYVSVPLSSTQSATPLTAAVLDTQVGVYTDPVTGLGQPLYLRDYVASWGSATSGTLAAAVQVRADTKSVSLTVEGLVYVNTVGLRQVAPEASSVGVQLGSGACLAQDIR